MVVCDLFMHIIAAIRKINTYGKEANFICNSMKVHLEREFKSDLTKLNILSFLI